MTGMFLIAVGAVIISLALSYAWWTKVRVINFRQDVFDIRDELFARAMELKAFDDPAYRATREHLNRLAVSADYATVSVIAYLMHKGLSDGLKDRTRTSNPPLQAAIDASLEATAKRLAHLLVYETATGWLVMVMSTPARLREVAFQQTLCWTRRWILSEESEGINVGRRDGARAV